MYTHSGRFAFNGFQLSGGEEPSNELRWDYATAFAACAEQRAGSLGNIMRMASGEWGAQSQNPSDVLKVQKSLKG